MQRLAAFALTFVALGCASTEDPGFTSVTSGETGMGETGDDPFQICADPEFDSEVPQEPTVSVCDGQGGGALVFDVFSGVGNGVIPDRSKANPTVEFPEDASVGACCGSLASAEQVEGACVSDCARAACNIAIATLADAVADPASLEGDGCGSDCAQRVAHSMEDWILPQLTSRTGYESCLTMARLNIDPSLDYASPDFEGPQLSFARPDGACMDFGCLSNVRLRVFCAVDSVEATEEVCSMATNDEHPDIPESDRLIIGASPTEVTMRSNGRTGVFTAASHGGVIRQDACGDRSCPFVLEAFSLSTDESVNIGPLHARNLTATLEYAAVGTRVGDSVVFDAGALQFRISGVSSQENETGDVHGRSDRTEAELPLEFVISNTSPATATFTGATFSLDALEFRQRQDELRIRVHQAPASPID